MTTAKFFKEIAVIDPDTKGKVHLSVFKHENGGIFAIDSSYLEQSANTYENGSDEEFTIINDPFKDTISLTLSVKLI